jgi:hypothetical protein
MTFETVEKNRKSFVKFCLLGKLFGCDFSRFSELLDFSKSCLPESSVMRNFNKVECHSFPWQNCILLLLLILNVCLIR